MQLNLLTPQKVIKKLSKKDMGIISKIEKIISPRTRPDSEEIVSWITDVD